MLRRPRRLLLGLLVVLLFAGPAVLARLDPALLGVGGGRPWLWRERLLEAPFAAAALLLTAFLCRRRRLLLLLFAAAAGRLLLPPLLAPLRPDPLPALRAQSGLDLEAFQRGAASLVATLADRLPPHSRVALVHRRTQPDLPMFVAFTLAPRLFFLFAEKPPDRATCRRLGIRWVLDVRRADHRRGYRGFVLKEVSW